MTIYYSWVTNVPRQYHRTICISFRYLIKLKAKKAETIVALVESRLLAPTYCNSYKLRLSRLASNLPIQISLSSKANGNDHIDHLITAHSDWSLNEGLKSQETQSNHYFFFPMVQFLAFPPFIQITDISRNNNHHIVSKRKVDCSNLNRTQWNYIVVNLTRSLLLLFFFVTSRKPSFRTTSNNVSL